MPMPMTALARTRRAGATLGRAKLRGHVPAPALRSALRIARVSAFVAALATGLLLAPTLHAEAPTYPPTRTVDQIDRYFGTAVADPYRWLEDDNAADTKAWVEAENKLTESVLDKIPFRGAVRARLTALANYPKYAAPQMHHGQLYFFKNSGLQNQSVLYVQQGLDGKPEVLIDPNSFSSDGTLRLTLFELSRDGRYAVYGRTAIAGSDWQDLLVLDMQTRQTLPEVLRWAKFSGASWRGKGFYYSRYPAPAKGEALTVRATGQAVYYHRVGTPQEADTLVYQDTAHPGFFVGVDTTEDEQLAVLSVSDPKLRGNTLHVRREATGAEPAGAFEPIVADMSDDLYTVVGHVGGRLLVQTTRGAPNGRLVSIDPARPAEADWKTVLPEQPEPLKTVSTVGGRLIATYLKDVTTRAYVYDNTGGSRREIVLPGPGTAGGFGGLREDTDTFYTYTSLNQPPSIYRYQLASGKSTLFRQPQIPGFAADRFVSQQIFYRSKDGTRIPMFLVHRKGLPLNGRNPTILYGYGGFNVTVAPRFSAARIAWLEQGGVFAIASLRGGGEYGQKWHEAGMRLNKQNVFDDFIAAAQYLIDSKYTSSGRLALQGGSNGGLLVAAVANQRPDLFKVALPAVGVMDMLRYQRFSAGVAWVSDYGSSDDETQFRNLLGYSPLHNIKPGTTYPATLVTTSDHDDRVVPAHSFKYIATLQAQAGPASGPLLIRIETQSGHGSSNLSKALAETADEYTFTWANMGFTPTY
jgi:prolyl oligopeptidase